LARTTRFMLTEEGHHMLVGRTGVARVVQRTAELMAEQGITDPGDIEAVREHGVIDLPTIQKKINFHFSVTLDLFGAEVSTNAANAFNAGIKGRFGEPRIHDDHQLHDDTYPVEQVVDGELKQVNMPAISAINARLLDDYINECANIVISWNRIIAERGFDFELRLPHRGFNRQVGEFSEHAVSPTGELMTDSDWTRKRAAWLPSEEDDDFILSLMKPETRAGHFASWIAPPRAGIDGKPGDFEYVRIAA